MRRRYSQPGPARDITGMNVDDINARLRMNKGFRTNISFVFSAFAGSYSNAPMNHVCGFQPTASPPVEKLTHVPI